MRNSSKLKFPFRQVRLSIRRLTSAPWQEVLIPAGWPGTPTTFASGGVVTMPMANPAATRETVRRKQPHAARALAVAHCLWERKRLIHDRFTGAARRLRPCPAGGVVTPLARLCAAAGAGPSLAFGTRCHTLVAVTPRLVVARKKYTKYIVASSPALSSLGPSGSSAQPSQVKASSRLAREMTRMFAACPPRGFLSSPAAPVAASAASAPGFDAAGRAPSRTGKAASQPGKTPPGVGSLF